MCPGGFIVPAATANGEVVVNGMSPSRRNNAYANSGIVVEINAEKDLHKLLSYTTNPKSKKKVDKSFLQSREASMKQAFAGFEP